MQAKEASGVMAEVEYLKEKARPKPKPAPRPRRR